ncbi:MAG: Rrf2 family transcriptional regulator [Candidatus Omnitrophica bacterium]|jgi:Rrf2 family protein|nr:Rrf2 family transcriptional regulator [Candidatus Omnitrophota bacterium]MDD5077907.1 Rrf2 family transcriptional regulator [Candidatus Omnitrophota bacterium]
MKLVTRDTDYAVRAICYIAEADKVVTVTEMVQKLGVPQPFMRKILQRLSREKILISYKGQAGGFKLKLKPERIFVYNIMNIFQGKFSLNGCFLKKDLCPNRGKCILRKKIKDIEGEALRKLKSINIASLIKN